MSQMCAMTSMDYSKSRLCHISREIGGSILKKKSEHLKSRRKLRRNIGTFGFRRKFIEETVERNWEIKHHPIVEKYFDLLEASLLYALSPSSHPLSLRTDTWHMYKQRLEDIWSSLMGRRDEMETVSQTSLRDWGPSSQGDDRGSLLKKKSAREWFYEGYPLTEPESDLDKAWREAETPISANEGEGDFEKVEKQEPSDKTQPLFSESWADDFSDRDEPEVPKPLLTSSTLHFQHLENCINIDMSTLSLRAGTMCKDDERGVAYVFKSYIGHADYRRLFSVEPYKLSCALPFEILGFFPQIKQKKITFKWDGCQLASGKLCR